MFEGFPYGPWAEEDEDIPPPDPPKWWEVLIALSGFVAIIGVIFKVFVYGI